MSERRAFDCVAAARRRGFGSSLLVGAAMLMLAATSHAQESNASLRGQVILEAGADLSQVQVTAIDIESGYRRTVNARPDGQYRFPSLRPGRYRLEVNVPGGVRRTDELTLLVGQNAVLDLDFAAPEVAAADMEEVVVVGQAIKTQEGGEVGLNITTELIESLPQNSRNFLAFADLAPGVSFERGSDGSTRIQGGAQNSRTVNIFIDGVGQKDYVLKSGITGQDSSPGNPFPQSAIAEYRVISQNYKAEFDQVSSAAITAVTKSGTNEFHGDLFWDYTDDGFRAESPREKELGEGKVQTEDSQFGISLGGPIMRDRLHFFVAYEGKRNELPVEVSAGGGVMTSDLPPEYADLIGVYSRDFEEDLYFGKLDFVATQDDLFQLSFKIREETGTRWDNGANAPSFTHDINNDETRLLLRYERSALNWVNDLRLTYEDSAWNPQPDEENQFILQLSGKQTILNVGGHPNFQDKGQDGFGIENDFTWTAFADHVIQAGVKLKWVDLSTIQQQPFNPQYFFNTEFDATGTGAFNDVVPYRLSFGAAVPGIGDGSAQSDNFQFGIYIQDDWQITDRLELNLGLRWDYERTPLYTDYVTPADAVAALTTWPNIQNTNYDINDFISTGNNRDDFTGAIQPRIGFTFDMTPDGQYVLFGGYGRSYDRNQFDFIQSESTAQTFRTQTFNFDTGDPDNPCPGCPAWDPVFFTQAGRDMLLAGTPPTGGGREVFLINNDLDVPYADQFSLGVRALWDVWTGEIGVSHVESKDGFAWLLGNRQPDGSFHPPGATWGAPFGVTPPGFSNVILGVNGLESESDSVYLTASKTYDESSGWGVTATYTYTDAEENRRFNETFSLDYPSIDNYPFLTSAGVSRHRLVMAGNIDLPWGFTLSSKYTYESPRYIYGIGMPGDPNNMRVPRVTEASDDFKQLDLALAKSFGVPNFEGQFRVRFDVLNVFNTANFDNFVGNGQLPTFGDLNNLDIGGHLPRTIKLSAGLSF